MNAKLTSSRPRLNRRAFLYGLGGVGIGLPFLESARDRSAWAAGEEPTFALFVGTANGIIGDNFWPAGDGPLTNLADEPNAVGILSEFAEQLLVVRGLRYPGASGADTHGWSYPQMLTGAPAVAKQGSPLASATAASLDVLLAPVLNADAAPPLTLYSGMKPGYINEAMSWNADGTVRAAQGNPFVVYSDLVAASGVGTETAALSQAALLRRQSAIDLARDELMTFRGRSGTSSSDSARLEQHFTALRDIEQTLGDLVTTCSMTSLDVAGITIADETYRQDGMVEVVAKLQLELTAFAFACNLNHVATLQSGDGLDQTHYDVPSNERNWTFHHISHQVQSDGAVGEDALAVQAHIEIDRLRMQTFAHGLRKFRDHQLLDKSVVMWANQFSDPRTGSFYDLPILVAGNPYDRLRSGQALTYTTLHYNSELLTTLARVVGFSELIGTAEAPVDELLA